MNRAAVAHMPDSRYCYCVTPGRFLFRLQTGRDDLAVVKLHYRDKYIPVPLLDTRAVTEMRRVAQDGCHDYYEIELEIDVVCLRYFFELVGHDGERIYYSNCRFLREAPEDNDRMFDLPQNLRETERFAVPEWAKDKVVYQIFSRAICFQQNGGSKDMVSDSDRCVHRLEGRFKGHYRPSGIYP